MKGWGEREKGGEWRREKTEGKVKRKTEENLNSDVTGFDEANMAENMEEEIKEVKRGQQKWRKEEEKWWKNTGAIIAFVSGTGRGEKKGKDEKMMGLKNEVKEQMSGTKTIRDEQKEKKYEVWKEKKKRRRCAADLPSAH